jgi:hypothetical protein
MLDRVVSTAPADRQISSLRADLLSPHGRRAQIRQPRLVTVKGWSKKPPAGKPRRHQAPVRGGTFHRGGVWESHRWQIPLDHLDELRQRAVTASKIKNRADRDLGEPTAT